MLVKKSIFDFLPLFNGFISIFGILDNSNSPMRDPIQTRNRFEGLLEGAIKLYSNDSKDSDFNQPNDMPGVIRSKDSRGKSAATTRYLLDFFLLPKF